MAPSLVHVCCGNGSAAKGFQDAGFYIKSGIDDDEFSVSVFRNLFPHSLARHLKDINSITDLIMNADVLLFTPSHITTVRETSYPTFFTNLVKQLKPRVVVLVAPSLSTKGKWTETYIEGMNSNCFHSMTTTLNTNDFNCAIEMSKLICISVCTTSLSGEPRIVFNSIANNINNKKVFPRVLPKTSLSRTRWGKEYKGIFLYPREPKQQAVFSLDLPLPPLRSTATSPPSKSYKVKKQDVCHPSEAIVPNLVDLRELMGLPPMFDIYKELLLPRSIALNLLVYSLPVFFVRSVAEAVFVIPVLEVPEYSNRKRGTTIPIHIPRTLLSFSSISSSCSSAVVSRTIDSIQRINRIDKMKLCSIKEIISDEFKGRQSVIYTIGSGSVDDCVSSVIGVQLPIHWTVEIRERKKKTHCNDDLIITSPTGKRFYSLTKIREYVKNFMSSD